MFWRKDEYKKKYEIAMDELKELTKWWETRLEFYHDDQKSKARDNEDLAYATGCAMTAETIIEELKIIKERIDNG